MAPSEEKDRLPKVDGEVKSESCVYKLLNIIGEGGYGIVFESFNSERRVAVKAEKYSRSMLHIEARVMRAAAHHNCRHICELLDYGIAKPDYVFIVITLLGKDLHKLCKEQYERRFSLSTAIRVGIECLTAIEELHRCGYLSRDIKPGNFAIGLREYHQNKTVFLLDFGLAKKYLDKKQQCGYLSRDIKPGNFAIGLREYHQNKTVFLLDFGLAKKYLDKNGKHYASRGEVGWRGTNRYGSLKAHQRLDLGRRDDLESWFYLLVEITSGSLPWRHVTDRTGVQAAKLLSRDAGRAQFLHNCPQQYDEILTMIDALLFFDEPKYDQIRRLLNQVRKEHRIRMHEHFDWEEEGTSTRSSTVTNSASEDLEEIQENLRIDAATAKMIDNSKEKEIGEIHESQVRKEHRIRMHEHFDWEEEGTSTRSSTVTNSASEDLEEIQENLRIDAATAKMIDNSKEKEIGEIHESQV
uniref:Protein kinase domain-containing protein n=1 Tax=Ascaris lumbricoides TaxID=6252 RepID=A0A0M3HXZ7_ASCLU